MNDLKCNFSISCGKKFCNCSFYKKQTQKMRNKLTIGR